jgi:hypothetical protein
MVNLKSLHSLWVNLATNHRYDGLWEFTDLEVFSRRLSNEGLAFLTQTLPRLGKALDRYHATTVWESPSGFDSDGRGIPRFLGTAIDKALVGHSLAVEYVRQMSYIFYKLEVNYDEKLVSEFLENFKKVDREVGSFNADYYTRKECNRLIKTMKSLIARVLCNLDPYDIRPNHGSGSTACRTKPKDKWHSFRYSSKLDAIYPYSSHFFYSPTHLLDEYEKFEKSNELTPCARVVLVPKDSRGPRVISCEPCEFMYIQQGLMRKLYKELESHHLTSGFVNFTNQKINQDLARHGSIHDDLCTLDLSEASDRVSWDLVQAVFPSNWVECFDACRSPSTLLPDGTVVELNKFCPMGSSCCFPVEALVFWSCALSAIDLHSSEKSPVWVYGDDIITKSSLSEIVIMALESIGLIVNRDKSFIKGPFRESCGGDYYLGSDVTPIRLRHDLDTTGTGYVACADLCNLILQRFGEGDATALLDFIQEECGVVFPRSSVPLPGCILSGPRASNNVFFRRRFNKSLQRYEHRVLAYRPKVESLGGSSWPEMLRKELSREPISVDHPDFKRMILSSSTMEPGMYADNHSVRKTWSWTWLGS